MPIAPAPEYILGIDILWGLALQMTMGKFRLRERCFSIQAVQAIIRGHVKIEPVCLPQPHQITNTKQYRLPAGQEEITKTVQELERVGIIRPAHSPTTPPYGQSGSQMYVANDSRLQRIKVTPPTQHHLPHGYIK